MLVWKQCQKMSETTTDKLKTFDRAYLAFLYTQIVYEKGEQETEHNRRLD